MSIGHAFEHLRALAEFAYANGFHEFGYDPVKEVESSYRDARESREVWRAACDVNEKRIEKLAAALHEFVRAAESWHGFHHGSEITPQCDWLCECIPAGVEALSFESSLPSNDGAPK